MILKKYDKDVTFDGDTVTLKLTQEETANFTANKIVEIQVRAYTLGKESVASKIFSVGVLRVLDDEVLQ